MGCRKYKGEAFYDDLTGETHLAEELERLVFVFDGEALEIDLDDDNASAFRDAMAPFVKAARRTSKARVLATLPKRPRHLRAVPDIPSPASEAEPEDSPETRKGGGVDDPTESEGSRVPETPPEPSDSQPVELAPKPALTVVPPPERRLPEEWAPHAPHNRDDQLTRVRKVRAWATAMAIPTEQTLTPSMFAQYDKFYTEQGWLNL